MRQSESIKQYSGVYVIIIVLCVTATVYRPDYLETKNIYMMIRQATALGVLSMGQLFVITAGGVDLSLDANMKISMVTFMLFFNSFGKPGLLVGILAALITGIGLGAVNGFIITKFHVEPFLATLFTGGIFDGLRRMLTGLSPMGTIPTQIAQFVKGERAGEVPYAAYILLIVTIITYIAVNKTVFGRKLLLVGSNPAAADYSGIKVKHARFVTYLITGGAAVLAAIVISGYVGYVDQESLADGMGFDSLIAVILGGNVLGGGKATTIGTLGGALATTLMINFVVLFGFKIEHQYVFKGIILLFVVSITSYTNNRKFKALN